jgi:putative cell wall-binding protein
MLEVNRMKTRWISLAALAATVGLSAVPAAAQAQQVRVSPNIQLGSDSRPFRGQDQIALATDPADPQHVVAVYANYLDRRCESSVSNDGGTSWSAAVTLSPPLPGVGEMPFLAGCSTFQSIEYGTGSTVYAVATLARSGPAFGDSSTLLYKSTNGGATWQPGVIAMPGGPGGPSFPTPGPSYSRPSLSVDRGAGPGGADRVYIVAQDTIGIPNSVPPCPVTVPATRCLPVMAATSNDSGATFGAPVSIAPPGTDLTDGPSKPVVNGDGSITVVTRTFAVTGLLQAWRSVNQGGTWTGPINVAQVVNTGTSTRTHLNPGTPPAPSASASYPRAAVDRTRGRIFLVYSQGSGGPNAPPGGFLGSDHFISPDSAVWFQRSLDGGLTWSVPKRISDNSPKPGSDPVQTRHPSVSVSPNGRVNIAWHDRRHWFQGPGERFCSHSHIFCEDARLGDTYYSYSDDGGLTFSPNVRVSDRSMNDDVGYDTRPSAYWNYAPQTVTVGSKVLVGWMDSRKGNYDNDNEDIYFASVDFNPIGTAPSTTIEASDDIGRSVALSKVGYEGGTESAMVGGPRDPANQGQPDNTTTRPNGPSSRNDSSVVIVNQNDVAGAMAGAVLGRAFPGPVLLSAAGGLSQSVKDEIARIKPFHAYVIGDTTSLSAQVATDVATAAGIPGSEVERLSGGSDAATAAAIATELDQRLVGESIPAFNAVVIANPTSPDAAAAVGLAAARRLPILYTAADGNSLPASTTSALTSLAINKTLVIGGAGVVSAGVMTALAATNPTRLGGADQYATSNAVVAEAATRGLPGNVVYVADGSKPIEGALLGGVVARATGQLVLAQAPLASSAAGQATAAGLTGISRFFLLVPAAAPPPPPPPPPPPAAVEPPPPAAPPPPPPPPGAGDTTAPVAVLSGPTVQKLGATVVVTVSCTSEPCKAVASATVTVPKIGKIAGKTFKLPSITAQLDKGAKRTFRLKIAASTRARILQALKKRKSVSARLTVVVSDAAGNKRTLTRTVRFKR